MERLLFRPHCSTTYVDAAYSYRPSSVVCLSVCHTMATAMATAFCLSMGYNFGCMIASDTLFDSMGGFSGSSYPMKT